MTMRPIRLLGDPVLRTPAEPVTAFDGSLRDLVDDLMDTLLGAEGRAGVAAPQIGVPLRVFAYKAGGRVGYVVNPVLTVGDEPQEGDEGCLSIPELYFPRRRAMEATVEGLDRDGNAVTVSGSGFLARALQHETGHLDGVLYIDGLTGDPRRQALRAVRSAPWARAPR
ncbi:peptide deformylase [Virgisporangium aliadipatigenens]|uniref:Peptide deformylase n=1 Tax=Virgisporangium aliadipatigenens TaxID=741659 RepID=A0A8J3YHB7_9ACTN|nr:peptide deformylase [Virgisporangium aliadipatigenens]GIJ44208.1 peptide deformylase [Virgisporangium aliadipatigenens]